jgi:hypothetical protein
MLTAVGVVRRVFCFWLQKLWFVGAASLRSVTAVAADRESDGVFEKHLAEDTSVAAVRS